MSKPIRLRDDHVAAKNGCGNPKSSQDVPCRYHHTYHAQKTPASIHLTLYVWFNSVHWFSRVPQTYQIHKLYIF